MSTRMVYTWPKNVPPLDQITAERAFRRLHKFALGVTCDAAIEWVTGNRHTWYDGGSKLDNPLRKWKINVTQGWPTFIWMLAQAFDRIANNKWDAAQQAAETARIVSDGDESLARAAHAAVWRQRRNKDDRKHLNRLHHKLIREVIKRGWLEGKGAVRSRVKAPPTQVEIKQKELVAIDKRIKAWTTRRKRAETALGKLSRKRKYAVRAIERAGSVVEGA